MTEQGAWPAARETIWMDPPSGGDPHSALAAYRILDTPPEAAFDQVVALASSVFDVPAAMIGFIDGHRVWFKARKGLDLAEVESAPGLCASAVLQDGPYVIEDAANDPRTARHPLVAGKNGVRFYAAVPIAGPAGSNIGTLCLFDSRPRTFTARETESLERLGALVEQILELRLSRIAEDELHRDQLAMADALPHVVWSAQPDGALDFVSRNLQEFSGLQELDLAGGGWMQILHPQDREPTVENWSRCIQAQEPFEIEFRIYHAASQTHRWHLIAARAHRNDDGAVVRWYGTAIDIHDRKLAETALKSSENRLRAIIENEPECVKIVSRDGILSDMNAAGLRMVEAATSRQVLGGAIAPLIHPDDRERFAELHRRALAGESVQDSFRIRGLRGGQRRVESHSTPLHGADGKIDAVLSVTRDITDKQHAAAKIAEEAQKNRSILNAIPSGVHGMDAGGRIVFENPAALAMFDYEEGEVIGKRSHDLIHHHRADGAPYPVEECPIYRTLRDGITRRVDDEVFFRKDGSSFPVEYTVAPNVDAAGAVTGAVVSFHDITAERREADLRALEAGILDMTSAGMALPKILNHIGNAVDRMLPGARSSILLVDGSHLRHGAGPNLPDSFNRAVDGLVIAEGSGSCGTAAWRRSPVIVSDIATDPLCADFRGLAAEHGLQTCWSTPVLDAAEEPIATFAIYYAQAKSPDPAGLRFIERIGQYVRVAIERARQHESLERSEERYRSLYRLVPVSITEEDWRQVITMIARLRQEGVTDFAGYFDENPDFVRQALGAIVIVDANDATLDMFEAREESEITAALRTVIATPDSLSAFGGQLVALANGETVYETEMGLRTVNGRLIHVLKSMSFPPPGDDSGRVLVSVMDITERKQAEERFLTVAQATSDVVWDWNVITGKVWWNEGMATVFGHDAATVNPDTRSWTSHIHPDDRQRVLQTFRQVVDGRDTVWLGEYRFRRADGSYAHVADKGIVVRDDAGNPIRMIGSMIDQTERLHLEAQLQQSQRLDAIGQLTGGVAHDFNNLLTVILGNAETLSESLAHDPRLGMLADVTAKAAERGAELTGRLLAFARRQSLDPQATDINRLIVDLDRLVRRTLGEHIEIELVRGARVWQAMIDQGQLENAILNLCINARDAMPDGGRLTIETGNATLEPDYAAQYNEVDPGQYVMIAISDSGTGMTPSVLERVFEPFFTTKEVGKGSGLGLSMVYGFVKQSKGHLRIYSEPGEGTTVKLYLPRADAFQNTDEDEATPAVLQRGSEKILLVEDDDLVRDHVFAQLTGFGYTVIRKRNGVEALEAIRVCDDFDLLFTDVVMPGGLSGRQLAEEARLLRPKLAILFTSGYTENAIVHQGRLERGVHLLAKPYRRQELADKVRFVIEETSG